MRRSKVEAAETRERIVRTASELFLKNGLAAVGMRDVMGAVGMTQGGFYRHFESKEQLVAEANAASAERLFRMVREKIAGLSRAQALETIVTTYLHQAKDKKNLYQCTLAMIGAELSHAELSVRKVAVMDYRRIVRLVADHLPQEDKSEKAAIASGIVSLMVGAVTLANIASSQTMRRTTLANAKAAIQLLSTA